MVRTLTNSAMLTKPKQRILKRAVSQCLSITMEFLGLKVPSLLDSGPMVMLIHEAYFNKYILPLLHGTAEELAEAHSLFHSQPLIIKTCQSRGISRLTFLYLGFKFHQLGFW